MKNLLKTPIAHRGLHGNGIPENSLPAFQAAAEAGFAIETDVHFTKDKKIVIFHDNSLLRMTGDKRNIADCTFSELCPLRLKGTNEQIPLLSDFLRLIKGRVPILLEIKNEPTANTKEFLQAIAKELDGYKGEYAVQSFQPLYVREYKKLRPQIPCGILTEASPSPSDFAPPFAVLKRKIVSHMSLNFLVKPDFISFYFQEPTKKMQKFKGAKFAWTIRSEQDELLARRHADNIIFEKFLPKFDPYPPALWLTVKGIIDKNDPMGLLEMGCPPDEYDIEIAAICDKIEHLQVVTSNDIKDIVQSVIQGYFDTTLPNALSEVISDELMKNLPNR